MNVEIRNTSAVEKRIGKGIVVGEICAIKAVLPIKLFNDPQIRVKKLMYRWWMGRVNLSLKSGSQKPT